jgi:D-3-phosphoglycerate dehydrogenase
VVERAQAFGLEVMAANDPAMTEDEAAELGVTMLPLEELLPKVDYLTLHVPLTDSTSHLIGEAEIELMKPTAFVINAARGSVIDQAALIEALEEGRLAGAALDVYEREPIAPDNPLCGMENVVLSSHAAWYSEDALHDVKAKTARAVADFFEGSVPQSVLNPSVLAGEEGRAPTSAT